MDTTRTIDSVRKATATLIGPEQTEARQNFARRHLNEAYSTLAQQLNGYRELSVKVTLLAMAEAVLAARTQREQSAALAPLRTMAAHLGCTLTPLPAAVPCDDPLLAMAQVAAEVGDVARKLADAVADGRIDPDEVQAIGAEIVEAHGALRSLYVDLSVQAHMSPPLAVPLAARA